MRIFAHDSHYFRGRLQGHTETQYFSLVIVPKGNFWTKDVLLFILCRCQFQAVALAFFESSLLNIKYLVYKVCGLQGPIWRNFFRSNLHLLAQNLVPDFFSVPSIIRPPSEHEFIGYNSNGIVIDRKRVVLPAHNLGRHISWSSTRISAIIWLY